MTTETLLWILGTILAIVILFPVIKLFCKVCYWILMGLAHLLNVIMFPFRAIFWILALPFKILGFIFGGTSNSTSSSYYAPARQTTAPARQAYKPARTAPTQTLRVPYGVEEYAKNFRNIHSQDVRRAHALSAIAQLSPYATPAYEYNSTVKLAIEEANQLLRN